jgi:16S rRNA (guanine966-N2)-methyltransferase
MRVIGGSARGCVLQAVPGTTTRPISDRVKEALFGILGSSLIGAHVLDLFAGTGSVAIEALSRGAAGAVLVESGAKAVATIRANLMRAQFPDQAEVVRADVFRYLNGAPRPFDIIYIAPPQYLDLWSKAVEAIDSAPAWLADEGVVIVQIFPKEFRPLSLASLVLTDRRTYGSTLLCFYEPALASIRETSVS